jgi:hypothetical protein
VQGASKILNGAKAALNTAFYHLGRNGKVLGHQGDKFHHAHRIEQVAKKCLGRYRVPGRLAQILQNKTHAAAELIDQMLRWELVHRHQG